jgi:hypothetical protein
MEVPETLAAKAVQVFSAGFSHVIQRLFAQALNHMQPLDNSLA